MKYPQWKKRLLQAKAEREAAERKARDEAFWAAVPPPQPKRGRVDYDKGLPIG